MITCEIPNAKTGRIPCGNPAIAYAQSEPRLMGNNMASVDHHAYVCAGHATSIANVIYGGMYKNSQAPFVRFARQFATLNQIGGNK